jgi:hypothetical protein
MSDLSLEQQINFKFCLKLGTNTNDTRAVHPKSYGKEAMRSQMILGGINGSKTARMLKSQTRRWSSLCSVSGYCSL